MNLESHSNTVVPPKRPNFYRRRNTAAYSFMAWTAFAIAAGFEFVGIYTLQEPLSVKGYYAVCGVLIIISSFMLQKVVRDNDEDDFLQEQNPYHRKRNTSAFTFLAWAGFVIAILFEYIGLYTLKEPLYVKGYYAIAAAFLVVSCFVLQKTIRDNEEDDYNLGVSPSSEG
ncbi:hypothetical protein PUR_35880 [Paenibacillus sp. URB8-2]|nr:hypothetical protein PUR_35880 [Paenibacillus sp. URB8-2]